MMAQSAVKRIALKDLLPDPKNARLHPDANKAALSKSFERFGAARSIVIDKDDVVRAGNGAIEAAMAAGIQEAILVETDGKQLVVVKRPNWTESEAKGYALADNAIGLLSEWDDAVLAETFEELKLEGDEGLLLATGFEIEEIEQRTNPPGPVQEDEQPPVPAVPITRPGDLWLLGEHRLLCGDSTKAEDVAKLLAGRTPFIMVTDPPYGVEHDPSWREDAGVSTYGPQARGLVSNDDRVDWTPAYKLFSGHVAYVWHAGRFAADLVLSLRDADFSIRTQVIWRKPQIVFGRGHYHWQHEPCWYAVRSGGSAKWCGDRTQSTIWEIASMHVMGGGRGKEDNPVTGHSTQKPVECMARPIRNHGGPDDDVYDPFVGSGTTIIAAQQLNRRCFACEITPAYVDVCVTRWEKLTGLSATLEVDGRTFAEIAHERLV